MAPRAPWVSRRTARRRAILIAAQTHGESNLDAREGPRRSPADSHVWRLGRQLKTSGVHLAGAPSKEICSKKSHEKNPAERLMKQLMSTIDSSAARKKLEASHSIGHLAAQRIGSLSSCHQALLVL